MSSFVAYIFPGPFINREKCYPSDGSRNVSIAMLSAPEGSFAFYFCDAKVSLADYEPDEEPIIGRYNLSPIYYLDGLVEEQLLVAVIFPNISEETTEAPSSWRFWERSKKKTYRPAPATVVCYPDRES